MNDKNVLIMFPTCTFDNLFFLLLAFGKLDASVSHRHDRFINQCSVIVVNTEAYPAVYLVSPKRLLPSDKYEIRKLSLPEQTTGCTKKSTLY